MSRRLTDDDGDKIGGRGPLDPQTAETQIAAQTEAAADRVQIHVKVDRKTRMRLKVLADGAGTSYQDLAERFILEGIQRGATATTKRGK